MDLVDIAKAESWPKAVQDGVDQLSQLAERYNPRSTPSWELRLDTDKAEVAAEQGIVEAFGDALLLAHHATRLLPGERIRIAQAGLQPLSDEARKARLRAAQQEHPDVLTDEIVAGLLHEARNELPDVVRDGLLWMVLPLTAEARDNLDAFHSLWGGESLGLPNDPLPDDLRRALRELTLRSDPFIIEFGIHPAELEDGCAKLWQLMLAHAAGYEGTHRAWDTKVAIPSDRIVKLIEA